MDPSIIIGTLTTVISAFFLIYFTIISNTHPNPRTSF